MLHESNVVEVKHTLQNLCEKSAGDNNEYFTNILQSLSDPISPPSTSLNNLMNL